MHHNNTFYGFCILINSFLLCKKLIKYSSFVILLPNNSSFYFLFFNYLCICFLFLFTFCPFFFCTDSDKFTHLKCFLCMCVPRGFHPPCIFPCSLLLLLYSQYSPLLTCYLTAVVSSPSPSDDLSLLLFFIQKTSLQSQPHSQAPSPPLFAIKRKFKEWRWNEVLIVAS